MSLVSLKMCSISKENFGKSKEEASCNHFEVSIQEDERVVDREHLSHLERELEED